MILITGANGHFGTAVIEQLLAKGVKAGELAAMVRTEEKAEGLKKLGLAIRLGDYANYASLVAAFKGVDKLVLVSSSDLNNRSEQHSNAVRAAKEAGVKHIYYTSFERKNETESSAIAFIAQSHIVAEEQIKASGMQYTIFRNNIYADMLPMFLGEQVLENGVFFPAGDTPVAFTFRNDMAEAMANVLLEAGHENKDYVISNDTAVSFNDIAKYLSEASAKQINHVNPDNNTYQTVLKQAGVPEQFVHMFAGFAEAMKQGEFNVSKTDLPQLLKRAPLAVKAFIHQVYGQKELVN